MRILVVLPAFRPTTHLDPVGGGEISNRDLMLSLANRGHDVVIYAFNAGDGWPSSIGGASVIDGGLGGFSSPVSKLVRVVRSRRKLMMQVRVFAPDVILASTSTVGICMSLSKRTGAPVAALVRARDDIQFPGASTARRLARRLLYGGSHWTEAPCLIANSRFLLDFCRKEGFAGRGWVVYPPVKVEIARRGWPSSVESIAMVGSSIQKGTETFLELARRMPHTEFKLIGDRSLPAGARTSCANVTRVGWTNEPIAEIDKCDALLMPSRFGEAFGRAAVEAIRRKKFVIVSKVDGLPEAVTDERLMVDPLDLEAWHERVSQLVIDPTAFLSAMGNALEAARVFDLPKQTIRLERALVEILN